MRLRLWLVLVSCLGCVCRVSAQSEPAPPPAAPESAPPPDGTLVFDQDYAYPAEPELVEDPDEVRYGFTVALEGSRAFASSAAGLGTSLSFLIKPNSGAGLAQLGLLMWPHALRTGPDGITVNGDSVIIGPNPRLSLRDDWEFFVAAAYYPFDFDALDLGFYLRLTSSSLGSEMTGFAELGLSLQWSFAKGFALRYQVAPAMKTNFHDSQLVSTLALDVVL
jgi:hypothetical protein